MVKAIFVNLRRGMPSIRLLLPVLALLLAGQPALAKEMVKIGATPSLLYLPLYVAMDEGLLAKSDVEVEVIGTGNPLPALISGEIDLMIRAGDTAIVAALRGKPTPAIVMIQQKSSLSFDVRKADAPPSGLKFPENLKQMAKKPATIGIVAKGTSSELFARQIMDELGLKEDQGYSLIVMGGASGILTALNAGRIDAGVLFPPFAQQGYLAGYSAPIVQQWLGEGPELLRNAAGQALLANVEFLKGRPKVAKALVDAIVQAEAFMRKSGNMDRLIEIGAKYTGVSDKALLAASIESVVRLAEPATTCEMFAEAAKVLVVSGSIDKAPACDQVIALEFAPK